MLCVMRYKAFRRLGKVARLDAQKSYVRPLDGKYFSLAFKSSPIDSRENDVRGFNIKHFAG